MQATEIKERPILFTADMVRAILDGRKTQTRRIIGSPSSFCCDCNRDVGVPKDGLVLWTDPATGYPRDINDPRWLWQPAGLYDQCCGCDGPFWKCPFGVSGDRLYVRECCSISSETMPIGGSIKNREPDWRAWYRADNDRPTWAETKWRPSIHMPRWASRILLEVTDVRVERVREITYPDVLADFCPDGITAERMLATFTGRKFQTEWCQQFWDSINASRGYGWAANPWVWVVSFKVIEGGNTNV